MDLQTEVVRLQVRMESLVERLTKLEAENREMFGLVRELSGKIGVTTHFEDMARQLGEIRRENIHQSQEIGSLQGAMKSIVDAMTKSRDSALASAASSITINVEGGDGGKSFGGDNNGDVIGGNKTTH